MRPITPFLHQRWNQRCMVESSPNSRGRRFHWHPDRIRKMIPSNAARWSIRSGPKGDGGSSSASTASTFPHSTSSACQIVGSTSAELANAYCEQARLRYDELFAQLWSNTDSADTALARRVLAGRYTWLEAGIVDPSAPGHWVASAG